MMSDLDGEDDDDDDDVDDDEGEEDEEDTEVGLSYLQKSGLEVSTLICFCHTIVLSVIQYKQFKCICCHLDSIKIQLVCLLLDCELSNNNLSCKVNIVIYHKKYFRL